MKVFYILLTALCMTALQIFCEKPVKTPDGYLRIATTIYPIYDITRNLAAEGDSVVFLIPPRANPHIYEPSPSDIKKLQQADLVIGIDRNFDGWPAEYSAAGLKIVWLSRYVLNDDEPGHEQTEGQHTNHEHIYNPHIWLSLPMTEKISVAISHELTELNPEKAETYRTHLAAYISELEELHSNCGALFRSLKRVQFFQWHSAWDFLANDYGLSIAGTLTQGHGDEPSLRHFAEMIQLAKQMDIKILAADRHMENETLETFKNETDARIIRLDAIGDPEDPDYSTYLKLMWTNTRILTDALSME